MRLEVDEGAFGITMEAMGIDGEKPAAEVAAGPTQASEGALEMDRLGDRVFVEERMDFLIGSDKGKAVRQLKAFMTQAAVFADAGGTKRGLMEYLESQTGLEIAGGTVGPALKHIPRAQAQMFRHQEP